MNHQIPILTKNYPLPSNYPTMHSSKPNCSQERCLRLALQHCWQKNHLARLRSLRSNPNCCSTLLHWMIPAQNCPEIHRQEKANHRFQTRMCSKPSCSELPHRCRHSSRKRCSQMSRRNPRHKQPRQSGRFQIPSCTAPAGTKRVFFPAYCFCALVNYLLLLLYF